MGITKEQKIIDLWKGSDLRQLSYVLATVYHETGGKFEPVRERGGAGYFFRMYDPESPLPDRAKLAKKMGALPGDGVIFYGRGYPQITWRLNYAKFSKRLGVDLLVNPDLALDPATSAKILLDGMIHGLFTGKKLSDYFNNQKCDWINARRIVNGVDCAEKIADKAKAYYLQLSNKS